MSKLGKYQIVFCRRYTIQAADAVVGKKVYKGVDPTKHGIIVEVRPSTTSYSPRIVVLMNSGRRSTALPWYQWSDFDRYLTQCNMISNQAHKLMEETEETVEKAKKKGLVPK